VSADANGQRDWNGARRCPGSKAVRTASLVKSARRGKGAVLGEGEAPAEPPEGRRSHRVGTKRPSTWEGEAPAEPRLPRNTPVVGGHRPCGALSSHRGVRWLEGRAARARTTGPRDLGYLARYRQPPPPSLTRISRGYSGKYRAITGRSNRPRIDSLASRLAPYSGEKLLRRIERIERHLGFKEVEID